MKKTYVLDTNVLIQAPYALRCFEEHTVVLPLVVSGGAGWTEKSGKRAGGKCAHSNPYAGGTAPERRFV